MRNSMDEHSKTKVWQNFMHTRYQTLLDPEGPLLLTRMIAQRTTLTNSKTKTTTTRSTIIPLNWFMRLVCTLYIRKENIIHTWAEGFYLRMDVFLDLLLLISKWCITSNVNDLLSICFISILSQKLVAENWRFWKNLKPKCSNNWRKWITCLNSTLKKIKGQDPRYCSSSCNNDKLFPLKWGIHLEIPFSGILMSEHILIPF